ncbi:MAG: DedA family protein, partial [Stellaceae bacterium]
MNVQHFIAAHGAWTYPITFVWTFFEGETFVLFAAFAAAEGLLNAPLLMVAAGLGSFAGDQCYFWLGRRFGTPLLDRYPRWRDGVEAA